MATADKSGIYVEDGGVSLGRTFGARRLKALLLLSQNPQLDDDNWKGEVLLHFGGKSVKGAVHQAPIELVA